LLAFFQNSLFSQEVIDSRTNLASFSLRHLTIPPLPALKG
jgi:hypothetical protein